MDTHQRAAIHEAIEQIATAREKLVQQEQELQALLDADKQPSPTVSEIMDIFTLPSPCRGGAIR